MERTFVQPLQFIREDTAHEKSNRIEGNPAEQNIERHRQPRDNLFVDSSEAVPDRLGSRDHPHLPELVRGKEDCEKSSAEVCNRQSQEEKSRMIDFPRRTGIGPRGKTGHEHAGGGNPPSHVPAAAEEVARVAAEGLENRSERQHEEKIKRNDKPVG